MEGGQLQIPWLQQSYENAWIPWDVPNYSNPFTALATTSTYEAVPNPSLTSPSPLWSSGLNSVTNFNDTIKCSSKYELPCSETPFQYSLFYPSSGADMLTRIPGEPVSPEEIAQTPNESPSAKKARRRVQNRLAQKSFRKRKQEYIDALEKQVIYLEQQLKVCRQANHRLQNLNSHVL